MSLKIIPAKLHNLIIALALILTSCCANLISPPSLAQAKTQSDCRDVHFVFARGSGESLDGPSMSAWRDEIIAAISDNFSYTFYELGSQPQNGHQYPAVSVSDNLDGYINLVGAYFSAGEAFRFGASVEEGIKELRAYVSNVEAFCPKTKFVLGGYSQGAMVLSASLPAFDAGKIIYVSTFGDPKLYLPEGKATIFGAIPKLPDACRGINLSSYRISVPDCRAYEGILGSYRPYQPDDYAGKLGTWCNEKDIMCSSGASISDHTSYASSNLYRDAAAVIARKLALAFPTHSAWPSALKFAKHNVAFVVDSTYSMSSHIKKYRTQAKELASRVKSDGGSVALVEYRDLNESYKPRLLCDFSGNLEDFGDKIDSLKLDGGGRTSNESALSAILFAMNSLDWQPGVTKSIILLTDAGYHNPDYDGTTLADVVQRSLEIDPVNIFVLSPTQQTLKPANQKLAEATSGQVFTLDTADTLLDTVLNRPVARLALSSYSGQVGDEFIFDASASYTLSSGIAQETDNSLRFDWDLDGDGDFELLDADSVISHTYARETEHFLQVRITDSSGRVSTMSAKVSISNQSITLPTIIDLEANRQSDDAVTVSFRSDAAKALLSVNDYIQGFVEIKNGAGSFILQDAPEELTEKLSDGLTVTLTPYSAADERGLASSITISTPEGLTPETPAPDQSTPEATEPSPDITSPENRPTASPVPTTPPETSLSLKHPAVPKAPNTGLVSREYR